MLLVILIDIFVPARRGAGRTPTGGWGVPPTAAAAAETAAATAAAPATTDSDSARRGSRSWRAVVVVTLMGALQVLCAVRGGGGTKAGAINRVTS